MTKNSVLIIPMYNPVEGWEFIFYQQYTKFCEAIGSNIPVVLSDDGSTLPLQDGVSFLQKNIGQNFYYVQAKTNKGKGAALKAGASHLTADTYLFTDIDFPYTTESMMAVYTNCIHQRGIVMGIRDEKYYSDLTPFRTYLSKVLRGFNKLLLKLPSNDTQCGLKAFDHNARGILKKCKTDRFLIDLEFLLAANQQKVQITPVHVALREDIQFTKFNSILLLKEILNFLNLVLKYRIFKKA